MANAQYAIGSFLGGEISQFAQGRFDKPDYRNSLRTCLNAFPVEIGTWTRRPGTIFAGATRNNGSPARVMRFDFQQAASVTVEYTDGYARFRLGAAGIFVTGTATLIDLVTPYTNGSWASIRAVQAEATQILLTPTIAPQALIATTLLAPNVQPQFSINPAIFNDGPYLDPFTNGVLATPSAKTGIITITLSFPAWDATKAYAKDAFVTTGGINYLSLLDQNVNNAPASGAPWWAATSAAAAINNGSGFLGTDTGRLVRLLSEPTAWVSGSSYTPASVVSYNTTGKPGDTTYWQSQVTSSATVAPGTDLTTWKIIPAGAAIWSWGKITALSNVIDRALAGSVSIGNMIDAGGNNAAFDGNFSQAKIACAANSATGTGTFLPSTTVSLSSFVGKDYSASVHQAIQHTTIYPSNDAGFSDGAVVSFAGAAYAIPNFSITFNLRGSASAPASPSDGTLLGSSGVLVNPTDAVTILSSDQATAWTYVWVEQVSVGTFGGGGTYRSYTVTNTIGQVSFFSPTGTGVASGVSVEILGPPLLYTTPVQTWRLGVYSNTTGWPTCGVYHDGRLYLGGAVGNRFDACYANGIVGGTVNFAPTDQYGAVTPAHAISYTFNSNGVNPILWMDPDLQGVKMGTQAGEWLVKAPTSGPIAPTNITASNVTNHGSANVQPCRTEHTTVFVQRYARKLLEYFPDVYSGKFSAPNLADKAEHIVSGGVAELAYTSAATPIIWGRTTAGALFGITYKRDSLASAQPPTFYGWHRHALGSGRVVESICAGPSVGGDLDALTMVTNDPATGIRHVEILTDTGDENAPLTTAWFLDDAVIPDAAPGPDSVTFSGMDHLEGKTISIFVGGLDLGDRGDEIPALVDFVVSGGAVVVPYGDGISAGPGKGLFTSDFLASNPRVVAGFTYNSDGQMVRPMTQADSGSRIGPAFAVLSRGHRFAMKLVNTLGLMVGGDLTKKLYPAMFKTPGGSAIPALTTFSGIHQDSLQDDYGYENGAPAWRVSRPFPASVVIVGSNLATQDQ